MMDGRVKTLHPSSTPGCSPRDERSTSSAAREHDIELVDLVVREPLPVRARRSRDAGVSDAEAIENIDIGGPSMVRAAAKNHALRRDRRASPSDYDAVLEELRATDGGAVDARRAAQLAAEAFALTAAYDAAICALVRRAGPRTVARRLSELRAYESASTCATARTRTSGRRFYRQIGQRAARLRRARASMHGKELSYNNLLDLDAALDAGREFEEPAVRDRQAQQPVRRRRRRDLARGLRSGASRCDPLTAFGGIIAFNRPVDGATRRGCSPSTFVEVADRARASSRTRSRPCTREEERPPPRGRRAAAADARRPRVSGRSTGGLLVQDARRDGQDERRLAGRHEARAHRRRSGATSLSPGVSAST